MLCVHQTQLGKCSIAVAHHQHGEFQAFEVQLALTAGGRTTLKVVTRRRSCRDWRLLDKLGDLSSARCLPLSIIISYHLQSSTESNGIICRVLSAFAQLLRPYPRSPGCRFHRSYSPLVQSILSPDGTALRVCTLQ